MTRLIYGLTLETQACTFSSTFFVCAYVCDLILKVNLTLLSSLDRHVWGKPRSKPCR